MQVFLACLPARQVRRKADPAKETVREFVSKWRDDPKVSREIAQLQVKGGWLGAPQRHFRRR